MGLSLVSCLHPPWPLEQIKLFITADMIGRSLGDLPLPTVFVMGSEHARGLKDALMQTRLPPGLELSPLGADLVGTRSDYGPFRDRKIPFLFFSTGEHPDYHTPQDVPEKVDFTKAAAISSVILWRLCRHVADAAGRLRFGEIVPKLIWTKCGRCIALPGCSWTRNEKASCPKCSG